MKYKHLKKRKCYFNALKGLSRKDKKEYLNECTNTMIHVICEACFNLRKHEKVKDKKDVVRKIKPIEAQFEKLTNENIAVEEKRQILGTIGIEVISLIVKHILPLLDTYIAK